MRHYERAIEADPHDAQAIARKGSALNNLRRHAKALEALAEAERLDPAYWYPLYIRACVLTKSDSEGAFDVLERALMLAPAAHVPLIFDEEDLGPLRRDPQFQALRKRFG